MAGKRKDSMPDVSGRDKKKQKTVQARTIAVQPPGHSGQNAVAGSSKSVHFGSANSLPGSLDIEKFAEARAYEINAMHNAMETARADKTHRAWQQLPRHLRRRAASHDVRRVPLRLRDKARAEMDEPKAKQKKKHIPQRGKAKRLSRTEELLRRQQTKTWLETHIWHAKRMHMEDLWGYKIAITPTEKSFRPSHRASMHGSIIHDASYLGLIEMKGPEAVLQAILNSCCDCQGPSPGAKRFLTGARACETHFYKREAYPFDLLAPVRILWRALTPEQAKGSPKGTGNCKEKNNSSQYEESISRIVWMWVHPSVFEAVFRELQLCVSFVLDAIKQDNPDQTKPLAEVELASLTGDINVFEIMGPKASQVIRGALKPVSDDDRSEFKKCWASLADLQTTASVPRNTVIGFKVHDPRLTFPPKNAKVTVQNVNLPSLSTAAASFYPTSTLAQSDLWDEKVRRPLEKPKYKKSEIDARRSKNLVPGTALQAQRQDDRIPVLMIQRSIENVLSQTSNSDISGRPAAHGWTLVIPAGWSMAFFSSLIFTGTRVGGQRERQTQAFESLSPYFPRDYPSTAAYDEFAAGKAEDEEQQWEKKPRAKRPNWEKLGVRSPWEPDWEVVLGLKEPEPFKEIRKDTRKEELLPAMREGEEEASDADHSKSLGSVLAETEHITPDGDIALGQQSPQASATDIMDEGEDEADLTDEAETQSPWLLRGAGVSAFVTSFATPESTLASQEQLLFQFVNTLRNKRNLPLITPQPVEDGPIPDIALHTSPKHLYRTALVRVGVNMIGRGCPSDMAIIYAMDDHELLAFNERRARHNVRVSVQEDWLDETEQSISIPAQDDIIGYVTTGSYSLSIGEGSAIAAIPLAKLAELYIQRIRFGLSEVTVKVRDRHEVISREAKLCILED